MRRMMMMSLTYHEACVIIVVSSMWSDLFGSIETVYIWGYMI